MCKTLKRQIEKKTTKKNKHYWENAEHHPNIFKNPNN